ncbi:TonB-dependent receptor plug domain-containing protein [Cellvibrio sp. OA-2007]|uniref:TonB-dependent receptor plug domain-containing protein n=1 Tax=Cellvibrio sp. OA-2007 TaxID=529823 RepID=UPI0007866F87|nr:TonB-dependent receptor [Cellvibrio sp. OA-2007]
MRTSSIVTPGLVLSLLAAPVIASDTTSPAPPPANDAGVEEMVVQGRKSDYSVITENAQKIIDVPGSLGDPLMAVFSLPGVISEGDGGGAPAVRGSSPSDNRYLVDGAPAAYVFHTFSTSIFNENIIQDFDLFSAGFGPRYSNAIGGIFDIKLRDPKTQDIHTKVDLSILRAGIFVEGDVTEDSAFYLSGRASLLHYFFDSDAAEKEDGIKVQDAPEDTDYQFKYQYRLGDDHKLTLSANGASDLAAAEFTEFSTEVMEEPDFAGDAKIQNTFHNQNLRWQFAAGEGSELDMQMGHYQKNDDTFWGGEKYFFDFTTEDVYAVANFSLVLGNSHSISMGAESHNTEYSYDARFINYLCTEFDPDCELRRGELIVAEDTVTIKEHSAYVNDHWAITDALAVDLGVQTHYNDFTEETFTHPRVAIAWEFIDNWTLSSSAGSYNRLPDIDKTFPQIGNTELQSPNSNHYTLGLKQELADEWSWSITTYYKTMDDLPLASDVNDTNQPFYTNNVEGEAYGVDLFINKGLTDRWYGWLAISASRSTRTNKLTDMERDYYLDTPLVVNWVMNYQINDLWTVGTRLTAQSGRAITPIVGIQPNPWFENRILPVYGEPYSENLPVYSRLDLRFKREMTLWGYSGTYNIDILNALNRRNVTNRKLDYKRTHSAQDFKLEDQVGMGIIPALGMSLVF